MVDWEVVEVAAISEAVGAAVVSEEAAGASVPAEAAEAPVLAAAAAAMASVARPAAEVGVGSQKIRKGFGFRDYILGFRNLGFSVQGLGLRSGTLFHQNCESHFGVLPSGSKDPNNRAVGPKYDNITYWYLGSKI